MARGGVRFRAGSGIDEAIGLGPFTGTSIPEGFLMCSYCAQEGKVGDALLVSKHSATVGEMKPGKSISTEMNYSLPPYPKFMGDHITHYAVSKVACKAHVLSLMQDPLFVRIKWDKRGPNT